MIGWLSTLLALAVAAVQSATIAEPTTPKGGVFEAHLLDPTSEHNGLDRIQFACPRNTFCLPRTACSLQDVTYDREWLRFTKGSEFRDEFGCGAFDPTATYVCCRSARRLDVDFKPTWKQWFFFADVDHDSIFPALEPWLNFTVDSAEGSKGSVKNASSLGGSKFLNDDDKSFLGLGTNSTKTGQHQAVRSVTEQSEQSLPTTSMAMPVPMAFNPWSMPFVPYPMFWPPFLFHPQQFANPMFNPQQFANAMFNPAAHFQQPVQHSFPESFANREAVNESPVHRARRSLSGSESSFKMPPASGGLWTNNKTAKTEPDAVEGKSLPTANLLWKNRGDVPLVPIPAAFGVNNDRCGTSSRMGINARILSGHRPGSQVQSETAFAEFPWHVAIVNGETGEYLCAGAIVSARFVLTVAHCVRKYQFTYVLVRVGDWDLGGRNEMLPSYDVEVANMMIHEEFYAGNLQNDVALVQLKFPLDFGVMPHVGTLCLPPGVGNFYTNCIVTGWGQQLATSEAKGDTLTFSRILKQTNQQLVAADKCTRALRPFLGTFYQFPAKGFVCAFDQDGKDSCFGDGGGALACQVNADGYPRGSQYHVVGLVSWGVGCGLPNVPSAYTAIWDYLDWIRSKIAPIDPYPENVVGGGSSLVQIRANVNPSNGSSTAATVTTTTAAASFLDLAFGRG